MSDLPRKGDPALYQGLHTIRKRDIHENKKSNRKSDSESHRNDYAGSRTGQPRMRTGYDVVQRPGFDSGRVLFVYQKAPCGLDLRRNTYGTF